VSKLSLITTGRPWFPLVLDLLRAASRLGWPDSRIRILLEILVSADRETGMLRTTLAEIAVDFGNRAPVFWQELEKLSAAGAVQVLRAGETVQITVEDRYWPYCRNAGTLAHGAPGEKLRDLAQYLQRWRCIDPSAINGCMGPAQLMLQEGIQLEDLKKAVLLGVSRKEMQRSRVGEIEPIHSLAYFKRLIEEAKAVQDPNYWKYLEKRLEGMFGGSHGPEMRVDRL